MIFRNEKKIFLKVTCLRTKLKRIIDKSDILFILKVEKDVHGWFLKLLIEFLVFLLDIQKDIS